MAPSSLLVAKSSIRAVLFDAVGTLIHPSPAAPLVYAEVGRRLGSQLTLQVILERFRAAFFREEEVDRANGFRTSEQREVERWRRIVAATLDDVPDQEACFRELFEHFGRPESWQCDPNVEEVARELEARGYRLGMASNYDSRLRCVWEGKPELGAIREVFISAEIGWRKPAAEFFEEAVRRLGLSAGECLFVGDDRANDYDGALAAGMGAVLYDPRGREDEGGVIRIRRLAELLSVGP
jgi:putative hydrolase of the HAD superfamily